MTHIATTDIKTVADMLRHCREYHLELMRRLITFAETADHAFMKPTAARDDVVNLLREFIDRKQIWNLISEAFQRRTHFCGTTFERSLHHERLLHRFKKEADLLYTCFCRHQQVMDPKALTAMLKAFLLGAFASVLTHLGALYGEGSDELKPPAPFAGLDVLDEDEPIPGTPPGIPIPWLNPHEKALYT